MNTKTQIRAFLSVVGVLFFVLLPVNLHSQQRLGTIAFGASLIVGIGMALLFAVKIPNALAQSYLPANAAEAWRWAINFALLALLVVMGLAQFLPL